MCGAQGRGEWRGVCVLCGSAPLGMMRTRMDVDFYINPRTGEPHCLDRGVTEDEALDVLDAPEVMGSARDGMFLAAGQTAAGRWIRVIYTVRDGDILVITAYPLRGKTVRAIRRARRKK